MKREYVDVSTKYTRRVSILPEHSLFLVLSFLLNSV
jgi:hypothetical protein